MLCCCVPKNGISKAYGDTSWAPIHTILDSLTWILPFVYDQELHKTYSDSIWAHISLDFKNVHFNYIYIKRGYCWYFSAAVFFDVAADF